MEEAAMKKKLDDLIETMSAATRVSKDAKASTAYGLYVPSVDPNASVDNALDGLRLQIKYLLFDLEATRRENRYLMQMLENRSGRDKRRDTDEP